MRARPRWLKASTSTRSARLLEVRELLNAAANGGIHAEPIRVATRESARVRSSISRLDFKDVRGQQTAKRALEVAAAGGHNILMIGPPGSGKTMLAKRLPRFSRRSRLEEALETTKIHSVAGVLDADNRPGHAASLSLAASHHFGRRPDWRGRDSASRRSFAGPQWRALSG